MAKFNYSVSAYTPVSNFSTIGLFDDGYEHSTKSAIDEFIDKRTALFALLSPYGQTIGNVPYELTNMILLGCVSAVESYIRKIVRSIINTDSFSRKKCEAQTLTYGAAISHQDIDMLPEALLEGYSFANGKNIKDTIKAFLDIQCDQNSALKTTFAEFSMVCQLRHCIVHRFGFLGSNNAITLGLATHKKYLEKPLKIDFDHLNEMVQVCENTVKLLNNFLFCEVLERSFCQCTERWHFDYRKDKRCFMKYFNLFKDSSQTINEIDVYRDFIICMKNSYGEGFQDGRSG
jgi:hypothetical protein